MAKQDPRAASRPEQTPQEARRKRRKKARYTALRRLVVLLLLVGLIAVLLLNWDTLAPDKLLSKWQDSMNDAAGSYPIDVSGTNVKLLTHVQNYTLALSDSHLIFYNAAGGELTRYSCTYSKTVLRTAGKYVLLAEQGGKRLQLLTRSMLLAELTTEQPILAADVNEKGQFAVLTQGAQGYAVQATVYDRKGQELYSRSRTRLASEIALSRDGKQIATLSVEVTGGTLDTVAEVFSLASTDTQASYTYTAPDTLLYRLYYLPDGRLRVIGEDGLRLLDPEKQQEQLYAVDGHLLGYAVTDSGIALAVRDWGDTGDGCVVVLDTAMTERCRVDFTGDFRHLSAQGQEYLLLTDARAQSIGFSGALLSAEVAADGQQAVLNGHTAIVLGLSAIASYSLA